jgi:tripartite-type tricarboxylate transporter receptor subunit TctC
VPVVGGLIAPAGVPKEVVDILSKAAGKIIASAEHNKRIEQMGTTVFYRNPEQFAKFWADSEDQFKPIMEEATR